jgi:hypothetical protein
MKRFSIIPLLFFVVLFVSCTKDSTTVGSVPAPSASVPSIPQPLKIVSQWYSPLFTVIHDRSTVFLQSAHAYQTPSNYDRATHAELAFVKLNYQGTPFIGRLRVILSSSRIVSNELCEINFSLSNTGCIVTIKNADRNASPVITTNPFPDMQVRYIVIPKILFESLAINWDDYAAVAQALNI